jgi:predicted PurR-regulated permease PerM
MPFVIGFILAYLLLPVIRWIEKRLPDTGRRPKLKQAKRITIIVIVYLLSLAVISLLVFYIVTLIGNSLGTIKEDVSRFIPNGLDTIKEWLKSVPLLSNVSAQENIDVNIAKATEALPGILINFLTSGVKVVQTSASTLLALVITPVFVFFILKDWETLRDRFYQALPLWMRKHTRSVFSILQNVVIRYIRGQLFLGMVVGLCVYILLLSFRIEFALPLAIFSGLTELVPMIGPWLGGGLGVLVTLALAPEKVIWVGLGYIVIQLLENNLLVPRIQGSQMEIHPAFILLLGVLGAHFAGILGFIIIMPLTMTVIKLFKYIQISLCEENTG